MADPITMALTNARRATTLAEDDIIRENQQLKAENKSLKDAVALRVDHYLRLEAQAQKVALDLGVSERSVGGLQANIQRLESDNSHLRMETEQLEANVQSLRMRVQQLEAQAESLPPENSSRENEDDRQSRSSTTLHARSSSPSQCSSPCPICEYIDDLDPIRSPTPIGPPALIESVEGTPSHRPQPLEFSSSGGHEVQYRSADSTNDFYDESTSVSASPQSPTYEQESPDAQSPTYVPQSPVYDPFEQEALSPSDSPYIGPQSLWYELYDQPQSPDTQSPMYRPQSPIYELQSPTYEPRSPAAQPMDVPQSPMDEPCEPEEPASSGSPYTVPRSPRDGPDDRQQSPSLLVNPFHAPPSHSSAQQDSPSPPRFYNGLFPADRSSPEYQWNNQEDNGEIERNRITGRDASNADQYRPRSSNQMNTSRYNYSGRSPPSPMPYQRSSPIRLRGYSNPRSHNTLRGTGPPPLSPLHPPLNARVNTRPRTPFLNLDDFPFANRNFDFTSPFQNHMTGVSNNNMLDNYYGPNRVPSPMLYSGSGSFSSVPGANHQVIPVLSSQLEIAYSGGSGPLSHYGHGFGPILAPASAPALAPAPSPTSSPVPSPAPSPAPAVTPSLVPAVVPSSVHVEESTNVYEGVTAPLMPLGNPAGHSRSPRNKRKLDDEDVDNPTDNDNKGGDEKTEPAREAKRNTSTYWSHVL